MNAARPGEAQTTGTLRSFHAERSAEKEEVCAGTSDETHLKAAAVSAVGFSGATISVRLARFTASVACVNP